MLYYPPPPRLQGLRTTEDARNASDAGMAASLVREEASTSKHYKG